MKKIQCGGFYVDDGAIETREGKPFLKTGGSDPIVENAKQTGGFGYTEQGEQTVVDNESVTTVAAGGGAMGQFATPFDIVDGAYTVIFNGTEYNLNSTFFAGMGVLILGEIVEGGPDFSRCPFVIASVEGTTVLYTESAGDYEITVKMVTDTVHKIDEKYLPEAGGGAMVVNMAYSQDSHRWTADKSVSEICESYFSGRIIIAKMDDSFARFALTAVGAITDENGRWSVVFGTGSDNDVKRLKGVQNPDTDSWNYGVK